MPGTHHIFDCELQWEEWVVQFMSETPGQFPPGSHTLCLYQAFALLHKLRRHAVKAVGQHSDLIVGTYADSRLPASIGNLARGTGQLFDGARYPRSDP